MRFGNPPILWLMLPTLALLGWFLAWTWRKRQHLMTQFIQARLLPTLTVRLAPRREIARRLLLLLAVALLFTALARPQWGYSWEEVHRRGLDIVVAIDTSRSMLAEDVHPSRLNRAKLATLDLLRLANSDRLGLVAFAGSAFLQCPLTLDDSAFRQSLDALDTRIIPQGGTALAEAIQAATAAFKDENNFKILVLISDGEDHDNRALDAAQAAAEAGLRIFTLGAGTPEGEILRTTNDQGEVEYIKDLQGNVVKSRLNENLLQQIALTTQGFYLPLAAPGSIDTLYEQGLAPLPRTDLSSRLTRRYHERFHWPLGLALLLLAVEFVLPRTGRPRTSPNTSASPKVPLKRFAALAPALCLPALLSSAAASSASALKAYESGNYQTAQQEYEQLLEKDPDDQRLSYNLGTAAYQALDYSRAASAFTNALTSPDLQLQQKGFYNLGNTLYRIGEGTPDPNQRRNLWQNATNSYSAALRLNPEDDDTRNNLDFVTRRLEELQQEQEQQEQNQQDPQSPQDQQDQESQNQPSEDSPSQEPPQPEQSEDQQPQSSPDSQPQDEQPPSPDQAPQPNQPPSPDQPKPGEQPNPTSPSGQPDQPNEQNPAEGQPQPTTPGQMTPQEARRLLDAQKDGERPMIFLPRQTNTAPPRIVKDW